MLGGVRYVRWVGTQLVCGILENSLIFVLTILSLNVVDILSKHGKAQRDCTTSTGLSALSFYETLMSCFETLMIFL